ncbi:hypothetical protein CK203_112325 [Vitis vinifera]|uniref:Retrovirus-related Pol polyprotein from transposon TNT 1-94-like beta-barrel domain-containing protein n=1 Tax=Vitis vinifera TaxID=29760 RepID=A0A438CBQ0_VITVI|nr:hypothetical protein CK203_112325 [Vitis vinifera]
MAYERDMLKIHGKPQNFKKKNGSDGRAFQTMTQQGNYLIAALSSIKSNVHCPWIIDSGATDHMTGSSQIFSSYKPCAGNKKIKIADGSLSAIAGKGSVFISPSLTLHNVLHVPIYPAIYYP